MQLPIELSFRGMDHVEEAEELVHKCATDLEKLTDRIVSCRIMIEAPHRHHQQGQAYHVRIDLSVPGQELVVSRDPTPRQGAHERLDVAIRDAFKTMKRQLKDHLARRRGDVKTHDGPPLGRVTRLFPGEGYGFLESPDGRDIYFHENAVLNDDWKNIEVGSVVIFAEEMGEKGPQASTVKLQA